MNQTFARYRVGQLLGRGGMAEVHEASLEGHDGFVRKVALKRVRAEVASDPELARLFADEARIASHLHHANLVGILDFGVHDGVAYQALELVEGVTLEALREHLAASGRAIPEEIALHVVREVAHGLAYAHRATDEHGKALGLVHRDVSPSNVLIGFSGDVKLTDFGIAFARRKRVETAHGVARGKPSYMAPEQATQGTLDARTDLFALGCTLHFALTGRSPLEGDEVLVKLLVGERAPLDPSLADDVKELVASAVSPDRRERPSSAEIFAERCDAARRARTERDGRAALRAWLAPLAPELRAASALRARSAAPLAGSPQTDDPAARDGSRDAPRSSPTPWARGAVGTLVVVGALAAILAGLAIASVPQAPDPRVTLPAGPPVGSVDASAARDARPPGAPDGSPDDEPDASNGPEPRGDAARRAVPREDARSPRAGDEAGSSPPPAEPRETGWVRVVAGCERARDGEVSVDARRFGDHVPATLRAPIGRHVVEIVAPSGERFAHPVEVTTFHTEGRPLWVRACSDDD